MVILRKYQPLSAAVEVEMNVILSAAKNPSSCLPLSYKDGFFATLRMTVLSEG
jgi:hypothetical protein